MPKVLLPKGKPLPHTRKPLGNITAQDELVISSRLLPMPARVMTMPQDVIVYGGAVSTSTDTTGDYLQGQRARDWFFERDTTMNG